SPEQLYDSLIQVVGANRTAKTDFPKKGVMVGKKGPVTPRDNFLAFFRVEENGDPTEYQAGIPQALRLMNSGTLNNNAALPVEAKGAGKPAQVLEPLYLGTLSRRPTAAEMQTLTTHLSRNPTSGYQDILWAILNSSEFALNH